MAQVATQGPRSFCTPVQLPASMSGPRRLRVLGSQICHVPAAAEAEPVLFDLVQGIATITLNRADNRNSMTPDLLDAFGRCIERCKNDHTVRCVVITGKGESFCAGA